MWMNIALVVSIAGAVFFFAMLMKEIKRGGEVDGMEANEHEGDTLQWYLFTKGGGVMETLKCWWRENEDGWWEADCKVDGTMFAFNEGNPRDNKFKYCPYCAKIMRYRSYRDRQGG